MAEIDIAQSEAAKVAATLVRSGQVVGLGSGTTAALVVRGLAERIKREGIEVIGVATSESTAELARSLGIRLVELDEVGRLDLDIDGADEVDPGFQMVKGRGGALLREKIVAAAAEKRVIVITAAKRVSKLGEHFPIPVEVSAFGLKHTKRALESLGARAEVRVHPGGDVVRTDGGNRIIDCRFPPIDDPRRLDREIRAIPGAFETGIFIDLCDHLIVGDSGGVSQAQKPC